MLTKEDKEWIVEAIDKGSTKTAIAAINQVMIPAMDRLEERLSTRIDGVEGRLGDVEGRLGDVESRLGDVESEVHGLTKKLTSITDHHAKKIDSHDRRIGKLELKFA